MGLDSLMAKYQERDSVTPVTSRTPQGVTAETPCLLTCTPVTPVTPVTPEKTIAANDCEIQQCKDVAKPHQWQPDRCDRCIHLSRFTGGNACRTANGLPWLFGLLYNVPDDRGATCAAWQADRWETLQPTEWMQ